jgi:tetratricopeptide (TPR) repeat protein
MKRSTAPQSASMARTLFSQGLAFHQGGKLTEARASYRRILKLIPNQPDALHMLGVAEFQEKNFGEAVQLISQATKFKNDSHLMHFNLGNALRAAGKLEDASNAFRAALVLSPNNLEALKNLGNTYKERNMMAAAISCYDQILDLDPSHAFTLYNKGIALLTLGELNDGWDLYEQRLRCETSDDKHQNQSFRRFAPDWDGGPLDKPLLVLPEQGLGDQIFYGAMLADLQATGVESFVCLDERLQSLFGRSFPELDFVLPEELTSIDSSKQLFGAQIQLASLGRIFRRSTADFSRIPSPYLAANKDLISILRKQQHQDAKFICGLSWTSANAETGSTKSIKIEDLHPLLKVDGIKFINLQYGDTSEERRRVREQIGVDIVQVDGIDNKNDINELAALISACDIVITVSNSTAHLAAALGKPTLVLLPHHTPLWYWHLGSKTSPWYPTVTLLRQDIAGDWAKPINEAIDLLTNCIAATTKPSIQ